MTSIACAFDARTIERFEAKVDRSGGPDACHVWTGTLSAGYGHLWLRGNARRAGGPAKAHRVSWEIHRGPVPSGLCVLHNCPSGDNPRCVNPAHLFLGTKADNMADMGRKGRASSGDAHWTRATPERRVRMCGERHSRAKITDAQAREIETRRASGERVMDLAHEYGLSRSHASRVARGVRKTADASTPPSPPRTTPAAARAPLGS